LGFSTFQCDIGHRQNQLQAWIFGAMASAPAPVQSYRDLIAWQKSMMLAREIYRATEVFPRVETYGLVAQLRRAVITIPSKIAEGHERLSGEYRQYLGHALGSLMEMETQILLAADLGYLDREKSSKLLQHTAEVGKILHGLLRSLRNRIREFD
jgi:four helix bundle protein